MSHSINQNIFENIAACIGNTPIVELKHNFISPNKKLYLKLEAFNPTFSIKDRTALGLVKFGFSSGKLKTGGTLIESTSGNLGKSFAMLGAVFKFKVIIIVDPKISTSMIKIYKAYGAEVIMIDNSDKNGGYQKARLQKVKNLLKQNPDAFWPNQYDNAANPEFHYETTALEILSVNVNGIFGAVSTGGHLCGIGRRLKLEKKIYK